MVDPVSAEQLGALGPVRPAGRSQPAGLPAAGGDFAALLRRQLEQVSCMQAEADQSVQHLLTGETQNITEVFTTARKADVAFSLLMEIRNQLVSAYDELKNLRV
jgi:flagellar hook-basal body complex protein FliE